VGVNGKGTKMAWIIKLKGGEVLTVNACRIQARGNQTVVLLDWAEVVLPDKRSFPVPQTPAEPPFPPTAPETCSICGDTREGYDRHGCYAPICPMDPISASQKPVQPVTPPAAPETRETALDPATNATRPAAARFTEYPETITGDVSPAFVELVMCVHPGQPCDSAVAALLCRQAYDLGKGEARRERLGGLVDATGSHLQASYLRAGADEIERLRRITKAAGRGN
jgi:hypothetical protein